MSENSCHRVRFTVNVCRRTPLKASTSNINEVLVETRIIFPLGLNLRCVHWKSPSHSYLSISKGPWRRANACWRDHRHESTDLLMIANVVHANDLRVDSDAECQSIGIVIHQRIARCQDQALRKRTIDAMNEHVRGTIRTWQSALLKSHTRTVRSSDAERNDLSMGDIARLRTLAKQRKCFAREPSICYFFV